jgi:predicted anti-sigma-YlaC factor YlaD
MIGVGIALIVLGVVFLFVVPWVGIAAGLVGIVLAFLWIAGVERHVVAGDERVVGRDRA